MDNNLIANGMVKGMEMMGAKFIKSNSNYLFFDIKIGSEIDNQEKLKNAKDAFVKILGVSIKVRKVI